MWPHHLYASSCISVCAGEPQAFSPELIGFGMVSFDRAARNITLTMNAPADQPFLTNMAVSPAHRRQGVATLLLQACEAETRRRCPSSRMYLQARQRDVPAIAMYECAPYHLSLHSRAPESAVLLTTAHAIGAKRCRCCWLRWSNHLATYLFVVATRYVGQAVNLRAPCAGA